MRWMQPKLFALLIAVAHVVSPRDSRRMVREIEDAADMRGFFIGYRVGSADTKKEMERYL